MKKRFKFSILFLSLGLFVSSCSNDDDGPVNDLPSGAYDNGILVSGEGSGLSGSVSYISNDLSSSENNIFFNVNGEELGNYLQSIGFEDDKAYIVVDVANTITVANRYSFEKETTITTGLQSPRYIDFEDGKGYVSNWGDPFDNQDDYIAIIDLATNTVIETVLVGEGPEQVLVANNKVFVSHKGGYASNNIISVIDISNNTVQTIEVADNPDEMIINDSGELVVLSEGATLYDENWNVIGTTPGAITKINTTTNAINSSIDLSGSYIGLMAYDNGVLYYVNNNAVFAMADSATTLPSNPIISLTASLPYGLAVDGNRLYVCDASFTELSSLLIYDLSSNTEIDAFEVSQGASKVYFN